MLFRLNRGTSTSKEAVAFRRWFYKLSELRSLVTKKTPFMAVTATATKTTRGIICEVLRLDNYVNISQSPNKENISYTVQYMDKNTELLSYFQWIIDELREQKVSAERTIIYCQTMKQCSTLYSLVLKQLGDDVFATPERENRKRLVEMLHSISSKQNKEVVLQEMGKGNGCIRLLICTIAFGMGVNCKGVHRVIHFGPSKSVEAYIQESGRAGRDAKASNAILLYQSIMLMHVDKAMKGYVKGKFECRQQYLSFFEDSSTTTSGDNSLTCML